MVIPAHHVVISFSNQFPEMDRSTGNKKSLIPGKKFKYDCDYQCFQSIVDKLPAAISSRSGWVRTVVLIIWESVVVLFIFAPPMILGREIFGMTIYL